MAVKNINTRMICGRGARCSGGHSAVEPRAISVKSKSAGAKKRCRKVIEKRMANMQQVLEKSLILKYDDGGKLGNERDING